VSLFSSYISWIADHKEDTMLHNIMGNLCTVCEEDESHLGNPQSRPAPMRDDKLYLQLFQRFQTTGDTEVAA
jgi:hypothetical protein